jgi:hypothetical protein
MANRSRLLAEEDVPLGETLQYRRAIERVLAVVNQLHVAVQLNHFIFARRDLVSALDGDSSVGGGAA